MNAPTVGARLRAARQALERSQVQMAGALQLSTTGYQNYERDERPLPPSVMARAQERLGLSAAWLAAGTGAPFVDAEKTPLHLRQPVSAPTAPPEPTTRHAVAVLDLLVHGIPVALPAGEIAQAQARLAGSLGALLHMLDCPEATPASAAAHCQTLHRVCADAVALRLLAQGGGAA